ncbi:MAG: hypothetical protein AB7R55_04000 [Gemmatimonadales bacterium]
MTSLLDVPFLTDLDSRAAVKGSRDPLGIQPIWTRFGRTVIGNLTTVSTSVRDFTVTMLGYWFAERVAEEEGPGTELATFLKWEQLAAYARASINDDFRFRGTERVRRRLDESNRVTLSDSPTHQILSNQKIYGLWGLYTVPARSSALLEGDPPRLTPPAREFVERHYLPMLAAGAGKNARRIYDLLRQPTARVDLRGRDGSPVGAVAEVLDLALRGGEGRFYETHLVDGGPLDDTAGRQQQLAQLLRDTLDDLDFIWSPPRVGHLAKTAARQGVEWEPLAHRLSRIRQCETVLAPASAVFEYLLGLDGQPTGTTTKRLSSEWGNGVRSIDAAAFEELRAEIGLDDGPTGDRWVGIAAALARGEYSDLLDLLLEQNASVMSARGGAPWVERRAGRLYVRFRDEQGMLPERAELPTLWRFPYFLDSLRVVTATVSGHG